MATQRFQWPTAGRALDANIVAGKTYRFTVLTSRLIRMEQDADGQFEDRATQSVFYRDFPATDYTVTREDGSLIIETAHLILRYVEESAFAADTLSVELKTSTRRAWHYGDKTEQLGGTARTLDLANGEIPLQAGVVARCGFTVVEDNSCAVLSEDGWFAVRKAGQLDSYFFGYGHAYRDCIADFYRLTGAPPLLPDYALGNWWSRYYPYTQQEYCDLMARFERENIPFSVSVVDMDWHTYLPEGTEYPPKFNTGWTGYTWNEELFPDYKVFLKYLADHNLKTALNLHPAQGVRKHEAMYEEMAKACGVDPASGKIVKFDCLDPSFMEKYFDILHHPYEEAGVNFWWMDWQQGTDYWWVHDEDHPASPLEVIDPLWLLNHLHIIDISRNGKRPMFFSRYCGLGSHRYPVGFSGDSIVTWESLAFQPYFTVTASNAGYSWWSHDIGGHMLGFRDDDMRVRWMQFGVMSPINRLHASNNDFTGKEPWNMVKRYEEAADWWLRLRHRMFPYNYTMNYRNHVDLQPFLQPMYYSHPENEAAYQCGNQYWFGSELIVAPITEKEDPHALLAKTRVWLPEGEWYDVFNGWRYIGDRKPDVYRPLEQMPIFAKAGGIVPMQKDVGDNKLGCRKDMEVYVFPGADNTFALYEDEGDGSDYKNGKFATTALSLAWGDKAVFTVAPAVGATDLLPSERYWTVYLRGFAANVAVSVTVGGKAVAVEATYDAGTHTTVLTLTDVAIADAIVVTVTGEDGLKTDNADAEQAVFNVLLYSQTSEIWKYNVWNNRKKYLANGGKGAAPGHGWCFDITDEQKNIVGAMKEMQSLIGLTAM